MCVPPTRRLPCKDSDPATSADTSARPRPGYSFQPMGHRVAEVDAHVAGGEHRVAVERDGLLAADRRAERHVVHRRRVERDHHPVVAFLEGAHRSRAEAKAEQAVERRRRAAAQEVAEHHRARLLAGEPLQLEGDLGADAAELLGLADRLAEHAHAPADRHRALGDDDDRELRAAVLALGDRRRHRFELEGDLGDEDRVCSRRGAGLERDPSGVAAHHLDDDHPAVRRRRREQPIDAFGGEPDGGVEAEGGGGLFEVVVDRLRHTDHPHARLVQVVADRQRAVTADRDQGVDAVLGELLEQVRRAVLLDPGAVRRAGRGTPSGCPGSSSR